MNIITKNDYDKKKEYKYKTESELQKNMITKNKFDYKKINTTT